MGDLGPHRGQRRDREGRMKARALRSNWAPSDERLNALRHKVEEIVMNSTDDRAKVLAYRALLESEIAIVNSVNQIAGIEDSQADISEEPDPEPTEPD
jgi:hypothetical protein